MKVILKDGKVLEHKSPIHFCVGYKAESLIMEKGDFEQLRKLAFNDCERFNAVMLQLEHRFKF